MKLRGIVLGYRYRLERRIAAGGIGQVWQAYDEVLERQVAVKLLRPEYAEHPETLERFRAEARHAGALNHPHVAQVYDYRHSGLSRGPYLVMEYVAGPSLADVIAREPLSADFTCDVIAQAASALDAAHKAGLVHRDVKPGNMLLTAGGRVKITDFGIAHAAGSAPITAPGIVMGTSLYMAPERIAGEPGTPASDLYSLGIVMWECLAGRPPFCGSSVDVMAAHLHQAMPPLPCWVPGPLCDLVGRLTAKDPGHRVSDAGLLAAHVRSLQLVSAGSAGAASSDAATLGADAGGQWPLSERPLPRDLLPSQGWSPVSPQIGYRNGAYASRPVASFPAGRDLADDGDLAESPAGPGCDDPGLSAAPLPAAGPAAALDSPDAAVSLAAANGRQGATTAVGRGKQGAIAPAGRGRPGGRRRGATVALAVVVVAGLGTTAVAATNGLFSGAPAAAPVTSASTVPPAADVESGRPASAVLVPASLVGQQLDPVSRWLRAHGLNYRVEYSASTGQPAGTVTSVAPQAPVPPGTTIIVTVALGAAPAPGTGAGKPKASRSAGHGTHAAGKAPGNTTTPSAGTAAPTAGVTPSPGTSGGSSQSPSPASSPSSSPDCLVSIICL
ncbi:MAG: serine/threonine protein kinase [Actinomycetia bacterium]|nr:serine/threonine protein kinase [Actinomycetes bacterium]